MRAKNQGSSSIMVNMNNCSICSELAHNKRTWEKREQLQNRRDEDREGVPKDGEQLLVEENEEEN